ncbi:polysaccharide lyase family 7 protein [Salinispora cortesiana]|uniref:polysaccharide lyase family 7 protein n=1 Tax=Salinispora cortesiana TaxID=1305843 RepID=UPI001FE14BFC|nr:polysaccharide lyase family 7 protein [Salinispora cortesiana]
MKIVSAYRLVITVVATLAITAALVVTTGTAAAATPCDYPAQQLDLTNWKVTLPTGSPGSPTGVKRPALATYAVNPWFQVNHSCQGVQFCAPVNGVTTSGSSYSRSELREMTDNGTRQAAWSATSGTHTLTFRLAFNRLPNDKPHVVGAQIHDGDDDVTTFRLQGGNLYLTRGNDSDYKLVASGYQLHTVFEGKFVVSGGRSVPTTTMPSKRASDTQDPATISRPGPTPWPTVATPIRVVANYGQVSVYKLVVTHS